MTGLAVLAAVVEEGQLLRLTVFFMFGVAALGFLNEANWRIALFAGLNLTLVRMMLPVALAVAGMGFPDQLDRSWAVWAGRSNRMNQRRHAKRSRQTESRAVRDPGTFPHADMGERALQPLRPR